MPIVPSVAMKGSILPTVVISPLASPQTLPATTAKRTAAVSISAGSAITPEFMNRIIRLATKATSSRRKGQVACGNDEGGAHRDDGDEGAAGGDVGEVVETDEVGVDHGTDDQQQCKRGKRRHGPEIDVPPGPAVCCALDAFLVHAHVQINLPPRSPGEFLFLCLPSPRVQAGQAAAIFFSPAA